MIATKAKPANIASEPAEFARVFLRILDKQKVLRPFRWNRAQRHFHAHRTRRDLILKARQLGFSTYVQGEMFRRLVTSTRTTMTMAHDDETTQKLRRMADRFWEHCKFNNIQPARQYANSTLTSYPDYDSEAIIATAGSQEAGRGGTYTDFHGSEVAFWKNAEAIMAGAMQGGDPDIVLESTPNGAQGYFYDHCMEALDGKGVWTLHFYPWWWDDAYRIPLEPGEVLEYSKEEKFLVDLHHLVPDQIKWRRKKQSELKRLFPQEYPEDARACFLVSGLSYFGDMVDVFTAPMDATYQEGHRYMAGLDFGQQMDFTSLTVGDITTKCQVDLLHINNLSWADIRKRIKEKYDYWHLPFILAESNSIGGVNIEALENDHVEIMPFETENENKATIAQNFHEAIYTGGWKMQPHEVQMHEFRTFVASQTPTGLWRLAAAGSGHDDTVISGMLMYEAANMPPLFTSNGRY